MNRIDSLRIRLQDLEDKSRQGWIPTTAPDRTRTWIMKSGSGLEFIRKITIAMRDSNPLSEDQQEQCDLWSRAEIDGYNFGEIARMCRSLARHVLGIEYLDYFGRNNE
jgi:hypothetical protein